jgi:hypothetical protein
VSESRGASCESLASRFACFGLVDTTLDLTMAMHGIAIGKTAKYTSRKPRQRSALSHCALPRPLRTQLHLSFTMQRQRHVWSPPRSPLRSCVQWRPPSAAVRCPKLFQPGFHHRSFTQVFKVQPTPNVLQLCHQSVRSANAPTTGCTRLLDIRARTPGLSTTCAALACTLRRFH